VFPWFGRVNGPLSSLRYGESASPQPLKCHSSLHSGIIFKGTTRSYVQNGTPCPLPYVAPVNILTWYFFFGVFDRDKSAVFFMRYPTIAFDFHVAIAGKTCLPVVPVDRFESIPIETPTTEISIGQWVGVGGAGEGEHCRRDQQ
jgi:hypothetical protein